MARLKDTILFHDASLVSYWEFESNSNDTAPIGNGYNGSDTSITYSTSNGKYNTGAEFSQPSSSKITISSPSNLVFSGDFTITGWIKPSSGQPDAYARFWDNGHYVFLISDGGSYNNGWAWEDGTTIGLANSVDYDSWQMITVRRIGTAVDLIKNGSIIASGTKSGSVGTGNFYFGSQSGTGRFITAAQDDVAAFSRGLSLSELGNLYSSPGTTTSTSTSSSTSSTTTSTTTTTTSTTTTTTSTTTTTTSSSTTTTSTSTSTSNSTSSSTSITVTSTSTTITTTSTTTTSSSTTTTSSSTSTSSTSSTSTTTTAPLIFTIDVPGDS